MADKEKKRRPAAKKKSAVSPRRPVSRKPGNIARRRELTEEDLRREEKRREAERESGRKLSDERRKGTEQPEHPHRKTSQGGAKSPGIKPRRRKKSVQGKKVTPRRRRESSGRSADVIYRVLMSGMIIAALVFMAAVFFVVKNVQVTGNVNILDSEVQAACGIETGDKLLFINRSEIADSIFGALPQIKNIKVHQRFPSTVVIEITERTPVANLISGGVAYTCDGEGVLLSYAPYLEKTELKEACIPAPSQTEIGKPISFDDILMTEAVTNIMDYLENGEYASIMEDIQIEKAYNVSFTYPTRFTVILGDTTELAKKMQVLMIVIGRLDDTETGTVDVSNPEMVRFRPSAYSR